MWQKTVIYSFLLSGSFNHKSCTDCCWGFNLQFPEDCFTQQTTRKTAHRISKGLRVSLLLNVDHELEELFLLLLWKKVLDTTFLCMLIYIFSVCFCNQEFALTFAYCYYKWTIGSYQLALHFHFIDNLPWIHWNIDAIIGMGLRVFKTNLKPTVRNNKGQ